MISSYSKADCFMRLTFADGKVNVSIHFAVTQNDPHHGDPVALLWRALGASYCTRARIPLPAGFVTN